MKKIPLLSLTIPFLLAACAHHPAEYDVTTTPVAEPAPHGVSLAGTWTYNPDDSDQPSQMGGGGGYGGGRGGRGGGGGFGGGFGGGGRGGFGGGRGGGGGGGGGEGRGGRGGGGAQGDTAFRSPPGRLVITQDDSSVTIGPRTPRDSVAYTLYFDGRDVSAAALGGSQVSMRGRWHKNRFEVSRELPNGGTLTEGYEVTKHGQRLVIHVKVARAQNEQAMPEFRRVYDRYGT